VNSSQVRTEKQVESLSKEREIKRNQLLKKIRTQMHIDFLRVEPLFHEVCADLMTTTDLEKDKRRFVQWWIKENAPLYKNAPDDEQATAIAAVHGNIQVIARAGSGKTTTLVNRAFFLIKHCKVDANEILLLAFNRKAALEIKQRLLELLNNIAKEKIESEIYQRTAKKDNSKKINHEEILAQTIESVAEKLEIKLPHIMTFHALAYAIVHPENPPLYDNEDNFHLELSRVVQTIIDDNLIYSAEYKEKIRELMSNSFREDWSRIINGGYDKRDNKEEFLQIRRSLKRQSLKGDYIKSYGEKLIADFLFEHDIPYKYEQNRKWKGINYRPDFTIYQSEKKGVIIEYFGLEGDVDYDEMSQQKRDYWQSQKDWILIEFSPQDIVYLGEVDFLKLLKSRLETQNIECIRLSEEEIWRRIKDRAIDQFTKAITNFIGRCRKKLLTVAELQKIIESYTPLYDVEPKFQELACYFYAAYLEKIAETGDDDFDGLMQRATELIQSGVTNFERKSIGGDIKSLQHICIDEFQDFSELFYQLIQVIRNQNPKIQLFCVGDDWQAINGFAGSDLQFFQNFDKHIGESKQLYISTNYRSAKKIVEMSNTLMQNLGKPATAHKQLEGEVILADIEKFIASPSELARHSQNEKYIPIILRIIHKAFADNFDVVLLFRKNKHFGEKIEKLINRIHEYFSEDLKKRITASTAHKYKGLEKAVVIIPDALDNSYPLIHPDWIFSRILGDSIEKIAEEERRLFYVALTRATEKMVIITEESRKSPFLESLSLTEIVWDDYPPPIFQGEATFFVSIRNHLDSYPQPTFQIKDLLNASGYRWDSVGKTWCKNFSSDGFKIENLQSEKWFQSAHGVEVRILKGNEQLFSHFLIYNGQWQMVFMADK
jgi:DNA helicase IV